MSEFPMASMAPDTLRRVQPSARFGLRICLLSFVAQAVLCVDDHTALAAPVSDATVASTTKAPTGQSQAKLQPQTQPQNETIIVTGSRGFERKASESLSPIDVVTSRQLWQTGQSNLQNALSLANPSINIQAHEANQAALFSAIRLRGLNPDQVLILVDGKRRHTTANVNTGVGPESGETPVDVDLIPSSMIDHIEVLRDGAAAQYGSDAIAGVVNIILKKSASGGSETAMIGATYAGDGLTYQLRGDHGFRWGNDGFIHVGVDFKHNDLTSNDLVDNRTGRRDFHQEGDGDQTREGISFDWGKDVFNGAAQFYGNGMYAHRYGEAPQYFRVSTTLPSYYPWGFDPIDTVTEDDFSTTVGLRGDNFLGFGWDVSSTYGADNVSVGQLDSANLSYLATYGYTPTSFFLRGLASSQWTNNIDLKRAIPVAFLPRPIDLTFGFEHRRDTFTIGSGDYASYYGAGSQALVGASPVNAGTWSRNVFAGYVDVDTHPVRKVDVDFAGRFEHYTDSGDAATGKVAARYDIVPQFAIRGSLSTGFRAPTLAEEHFSTLGVAPTYAGGQLAVGSAAAKSLGAVPLTPEYSTNATAGFVLRPLPRLTVTTDAYQINIRDRIVDGGSYAGAQAVSAIESMGIQVPSNIAPSSVTAEYYTNGASTRTQGLDVVANYKSVTSARFGTISEDLGVSLNRTRLTHLSNDTNGKPLLSAQGIAYLTTTNPRSKIMAGVRWEIGKFNLYAQEIRWGQTKDEDSYRSGPYANSNKVFIAFTNKPRFTTNLSLGYKITRKIDVNFSVTNLFDIHPTRLPADGRYAGAEEYDDYGNQMGYDGGQYFLTLNSHF